MGMKGFWRMMESVVAVVMLLSFLAVAGGAYFARTDPGTDLASSGYEKLRQLDEGNGLRHYAAAGDAAAINAEIEMPGYNHSIMLCNSSGACIGNYTASRNVVVSSYLIAGNASYAPLEVRLYVWW
jgi:hypothetical protein